MKETTQQEIRLAKPSHADQFEQSFDCSDCNGWQNIKSILKMSKSANICSADPGDPNTIFYNFKKALPDVALTSISTGPRPPDAVAAIYDIKKSMGPDGITAHLLKESAASLSGALCPCF